MIPNGIRLIPYLQRIGRHFAWTGIYPSMKTGNFHSIFTYPSADNAVLSVSTPV